MNLKEIRDAMFAQADWAPTQSSEAISRANSFINRAYNQLALEAPFLFFESKVHLATEPDVTSKSNVTLLGVTYGDRIQLKGANTLPGGPTTKDPWTWQATYPTSVASSLTTWKHDRSWDGRIIEITTADGTKIRNQIRSIWLDTSGGLANQRYTFTLVKPWDIGSFGDGTETIDDAAGFKYRIFTEAYPLPDDLIDLMSARLRDEDNNFPLDVIGQRAAENYQLDGPPSQVTSGIPRVIFRRQHIHMRGPSVAPVATAVTAPEIVADNTLLWMGPEPEGTFEYKVTYTWGKRDVEYQLPGLGSWEGFAQPIDLTESTVFPQNSHSANGDNPARNRFRAPRFESPASPSSNPATVGEIEDTTARPAIKVSLPNITYALGFLNSISHGGSTYTRQSLNQSGVYIRIYRKRTSVNLSEYSEILNDAAGLATSQLDTDEGYYLLAETRADTANGGVWIDRGEFIPDYNRRLRDIHGYQTIQFYPKPDERYPVEIRAIVRPHKLIADTDTPLIHAETMGVLIEKAMVFLYENMGVPARSSDSQLRYQSLLQTYSNRYGDLRPASVPVLRTMTRASRVRTNRRFNKRLTTEDLGGVIE